MNWPALSDGVRFFGYVVGSTLDAPTGGPGASASTRTSSRVENGDRERRSVHAHHSPTAITGLNDAIDVESGSAQNCARRRSGQVSCWGINLSGELGDGTTSERTAVRKVLGLP